MRLFKPNKSQGSLQNISVGRSPLHSPIDSPLQSPAFPPPPSAAYAPGPGAGQHGDTTDHPDSQRYTFPDEPQAQPGHLPYRVQSQPIPSHGYQGRTAVNNSTPDQPDENRPLPVTAASAANQEERRPKKHTTKRSVFGLYSSKEHNSNPNTPTPALGRSLSTKKKFPGGEGREGSISQSTPTPLAGEGYSSDTYEETESSSEYTPSRVTPEPDEQYYRQQNKFDSPQSQTSSHHSSHYQEAESQYGSQQTSRRTPLPRPPNPPSPYLPYNPPQDRSGLDSYDPHGTIRPPSQQSLGPPSPILPAQQANEPRQLIVPARRPTQASQPSHLQLEAGMPRGEANNPSLKQQTSLQLQQGGDPPHGQPGAPQTSRQMQQNSSSTTDVMRGTPAPPRNRDEFDGQAYTALMHKYDELQSKYSRVKKYFFEKDHQVTALQNAIANQRLSMSKTTLDDHEYTARFNRLDGAIGNLSFNIRKYWKGVPPWLAAMVNKDAHSVGAKEMTAVGRACITRWVVDEILERYFHPRLEPGLSNHLKIIERNIRRAAQKQVMSEEQREDLIVKLTSWRLTTLEGLADSMASDQGNDYEQQLTSNLMEKLTASLQMNLSETPPGGLESGVGMIIELAIGLASALPLESRDVCVEYYMPGSFIDLTHMKLESGIPPLSSPAPTFDYPAGPEQQHGDQGSTHSGDANSGGEDEGEKEHSGTGGLPARSDSLQGSGGGNGGNGHQQQMKKDDHRKKSRFGGLVGSTKKSSPPENGSFHGGLAPGSSNRMGSASSGLSLGGSKERESMEKADRERRIRFATFVGIVVRGKGKEGGNVLIRAPCYGF